MTTLLDIAGCYAEKAADCLPCADRTITPAGKATPRRIHHRAGLPYEGDPLEIELSKEPTSTPCRPRGVPILAGVRLLVRGLAAHPLGRKRLVRSLANIVAWQLRSRFSPGPHRVTFVNGAQLWARRGETGVTGNIYYGLHEFEDMAFVAHALRPSDLFADIGANAGSYAVLAAAAARARVIAVEPVRETQTRLRANIALNGLEELVRVEACALADLPGTTLVTTGRDTMNRVVGGGEASGAEEVPARTADAVFCAETPRVMKIDVEGHEASVLAGAARLLGDPALSALLVEVSRASGSAVAEILSEAGFAARRYDPRSRQMSVSPASIGNGNTLFVRTASEKHLAQRLRDAKPIQVQGVRI